MFTARVILMVGLVEMVLPGVTVRLTDGGFLNWAAKGMFTSEDAVFGTIESVEGVSEGLNDEAPAGRLTLLPPKIAEAGALFRTDAQGSALRFWLAEADRATGLLIGTPELMFDGLVDTINLRIGRQGRYVDIEFMANAERLFMVREGNVMSTRFHQTGWPGEQGFDHTTGVQGGVPWGAPDPARGTVSFGGGGGGGFSGLFGKIASS